MSTWRSTGKRLPSTEQADAFAFLGSSSKKPACLTKRTMCVSCFFSSEILRVLDRTRKELQKANAASEDMRVSKTEMSKSRDELASKNKALSDKISSLEETIAAMEKVSDQNLNIDQSIHNCACDLGFKQKSDFDFDLDSFVEFIAKSFIMLQGEIEGLNQQRDAAKKAISTLRGIGLTVDQFERLIDENRSDSTKLQEMWRPCTSVLKLEITKSSDEVF